MSEKRQHPRRSRHGNRPDRAVAQHKLANAGMITSKTKVVRMPRFNIDKIHHAAEEIGITICGDSIVGTMHRLGHRISTSQTASHVGTVPDKTLKVAGITRIISMRTFTFSKSVERNVFFTDHELVAGPICDIGEIVPGPPGFRTGVRGSVHRNAGGASVAGIPKMTLDRAKQTLGVKSVKRQNQWFWSLEEGQDIQGIHAGNLNILNTLPEIQEAG